MPVDAYTEILRSLALGYVPHNSESPCVENYYCELGDMIPDPQSLIDPLVKTVKDEKIKPAFYYDLLEITDRSLDLSVLSSKYQELMKAMSGLNSNMRDFTFIELAKYYNITPDRLKQIKYKCVIKLKKFHGKIADDSNSY